MVGLLTSAWTEKAEVAEAAGSGLTAPRLSPSGWGTAWRQGDAGRGVGAVHDQRDRRRRWRARGSGARQRGDDGHRSQDGAAGGRRCSCDDGGVASGTSTDAVVVAATSVARTVGSADRSATSVGGRARGPHGAGGRIRRWIAEHP